ncbi:unnamed protein product, partial [Amoebophrya sp. A25]
ARREALFRDYTASFAVVSGEWLERHSGLVPGRDMGAAEGYAQARDYSNSKAKMWLMYDPT